jgi:hypothetical protein
VLKIDAILKYGQPSAQVLSYDQRLTRSRTAPLSAKTSPTSRIQPRPPVAQAMIAAIVATDRRAVSCIASAQTNQGETPANSALVRKYTPMMSTPATLEAIAPWKSANQ